MINYSRKNKDLHSLNHLRNITSAKFSAECKLLGATGYNLIMLNTLILMTLNGYPFSLASMEYSFLIQTAGIAKIFNREQRVILKRHNNRKKEYNNSKEIGENYVQIMERKTVIIKCIAD